MKSLLAAGAVAGVVLVEGETTGHAHVITDPVDLENCDVYVDNYGNLYVEAKKSLKVSHEEHATIEIDEGIYRVRQVREYDHFAEEIRYVRD